MKEVLYITYDGLTDALGQSQILPYITGLSNKGYRFTIISCEKPEEFKAGRQNIESICAQYQIEWHPLNYHKKPPVLSTLKDVAAIRKVAFALHKKKNFCIVHCRSYISSLIGLEMKRKPGIGFIFDMRGFWADERVDGKLWDLSNPVYKLIYLFFKSKKDAFLQHSDAVISLTEAARNIMMEDPVLKYADKITVIPCSVDMELFNRKSLDPEKLNSIKDKLNSDMVVGYCGSIGTWYMLSEMLDQFKIIKQKYTNAKFLIVTKNNWDAEHQSMLKNKKINPGDVIIVSAERSEMPYYMAATNIGIFYIRPSFSKLATSPTKHGEMMSIGIPLITNWGIGDMDSIVNKSKSGYIIHGFNEGEYKKAADHIEELMKIDPELIRSYCHEIYSLDKAVEKYRKVYDSIISKSNLLR